MSEWTGTDVWVLRTLKGTHRDNRAPLADLIGIGDFIERAVFEEFEFTRGMGNLVAAGVAEFGDGEYWLTETGRRLAERRTDRLLAGLRRLGPPDGTPLVLEPGEFDRAEQAYRGAMAAHLQGKANR
ncbi:hypothetical protein Q0Z83_023370 [Actinoplanes sichuanensis]|uniref:Uncharacterized protein n=1 Tax=Actinoplanes sichuanensis TaxID=512349 RepID=A0ABW4A2D7_9ACTN|nr:hypothetical protein [Actinoplanes sichuanensis]BEL04146.1 hypothetical protein Q0Z83_023370 [Actinoplanes sichuanensis]